MPPPAHTPVALPREPPAPPELPNELLQLVDSLSRRLEDLYGYQIPQLANCPGPLPAHEALAADVRAEMNGVKRDVEELKLQVDDLDRARDRRAGLEHVHHIQAVFDGVTKQYRAAVLASKKLMDQAGAMSARDELFYSTNRAGGAGMGRAAAEQSADDALMSATSDVTEGLRRTLQLMQSEVDRSIVSNEMLEQQTSTLQLTTEQYSTLSSLLNVSKALITSLERADFLDRLILLAALLFFGLCCAYVFKRRVFDKGMKVAGVLGHVVARGSSAGTKLVRERVPGAEDLLDQWAPKVDEVVQDVKPRVSRAIAKVLPVAQQAAAVVKRSGGEVFAAASAAVLAAAKVAHDLYQQKMNPEDDDDDDDDDEWDEDDEDEEEDAFEDVLPKEDSKTAAPIGAEPEPEESAEDWINAEEVKAIVEDGDPVQAILHPEEEVELAVEEPEVVESQPDPELEPRIVEPVSVPEPEVAEETAPMTDNTEAALEEEATPAVELQAEPEIEIETEAELPDSINAETIHEEEVTPVVDETVAEAQVEAEAEAPTSLDEEGEEPTALEPEELIQGEAAVPVEQVRDAPTTEANDPVLESETTSSDAAVKDYDLSPPSAVVLEDDAALSTTITEALVDPEPMEEVLAPLDQEEKPVEAFEVPEEEYEPPVPIIDVPVVEEEQETIPSEYPPAPTPESTVVEEEQQPEPVMTQPPVAVDEEPSTTLDAEGPVEAAAPPAEAEPELPIETQASVVEEQVEVPAVEEEAAIMDDSFELPGGSGVYGDRLGSFANATEPGVERVVVPAEQSEPAQEVVEESTAPVEEAEQPIGVDAAVQTEEQPTPVVDAAIQMEEQPIPVVEQVIPSDDDELTVEPSLDLEEPTTSAPEFADEAVPEPEKQEAWEERIFVPADQHRPTRYPDDAQDKIDENVVEVPDEAVAAFEPIINDSPPSPIDEIPQVAEATITEPISSEQQKVEADPLDFDFDDDSDLELEFVAVVLPPTGTVDEAIVAEPEPATPPVAVEQVAHAKGVEGTPLVVGETPVAEESEAETAQEPESVLEPEQGVEQPSASVVEEVEAQEERANIDKPSVASEEVGTEDVMSPPVVDAVREAQATTTEEMNEDEEDDDDEDDEEYEEWDEEPIEGETVRDEL